MYVSPEIVVGFHGCDRSVADKVIKQGEALVRSENDYDWLGHGVYFWEGSYERALEWAKADKNISQPAVVGAFIKLGNCLDLLDYQHLETVKTVYKILETEFKQVGKALPQNRLLVHGVSFVRELDCQVILRLHQLNNEGIAKELGLDSMSGENKRKIQCHPNFIDSVRGMFPEGNELYPGAGFLNKNHIQLCIINPNSIIGYFEPRQQSNWYKKL